MGGGSSAPSSVENNGITLSGDYTGNAQTTYKNLSTGGSSSGQTTSAGGSSTTVGVKANIIPALQLL